MYQLTSFDKRGPQVIKSRGGVGPAHTRLSEKKMDDFDFFLCDIARSQCWEKTLSTLERESDLHV